MSGSRGVLIEKPTAITIMRRKSTIAKILQLSLVLVIAGGLKLYYSTASVNGLRWVLAPTAFLVEIATGETFRFESYAGYMNGDHSFLIAASCSGVNFLITAFVLISIVKFWKERYEDSSWTIIPSAFAAAYLTTIAANTVRIAVALRLHRMGPGMIWINPEQVHRIEGIFIYFGFLILLFVISGGLRGTADRFSLLRRSFIPLLIYWLITLGMPIASGAFRSVTGFWEHFLFVVLMPLILTLPLGIFIMVKRAGRRSFHRLSVDR